MELKPGRELDALVAEKVMGLTVKDGWLFECRTVPCPDGKPGCCVIHTDYFPVKPKPYSTSIEAAMEVLQKVKTKDNYVEIIAPMGDPHWVCRVYECFDVQFGHGAETLPLAICGAALKSVEIGDDVKEIGKLMSLGFGSKSKK